MPRPPVRPAPSSACSAVVRRLVQPRVWTWVRLSMGYPARSAVLSALPQATRIAVLVAATLALCGTLSATSAQGVADGPEEILSYDVVIDVHDDGWLEITEEIQVRALGNRIRRGIYRDFPTTFPREARAGRIEAPFDVVDVRLDGAPEPYVLQSVGGPARRGGIRIRIGDADTRLDPGEYTYSITYRTLRWIRYGEERDELYWNVTGNGWDFAIASASAVVRLPAPLQRDQVTLEGWTGEEGATASALTSSFSTPENLDAPTTGVAAFRTTEPLEPGEGLTIRVAFPKGVVAPPSDAQRAEWFRLDWGGWIDTGIILALVLAVYVLLWIQVGRDPSGRTIMIRYEPPANFTPARLGYLMERGHDNRQLTAGVVDLAVRGWIDIEQDDKAWTLRRTQESPGESLPREEKVLLEKLFGSDDGEVTLEGSSDPKIRAAAKSFKSQVAKGLEGVYFVLNRRWFLAGLALSVLGFAILAWRNRFAIRPEAWFLGVWLTFWTLGTGTLVWRVLQAWRGALSGGVTAWMGAGFSSLFATPFVIAWLVVSFILWGAVPPHLFAAAISLGSVTVLFYHLLERPTLEGRRVLDEAEGFQQFLTSTEEDRIQRLQPADGPLQLFERFLPWAIALGVESQWAERFESVLAVESSAPAGSGSGHTSFSASRSTGLGWYSGAGATSLAGLSGSLGSSLSSSLSSSSAAPSSSGSGGSSGGGSSGGGGGGGGGGGW